MHGLNGGRCYQMRDSGSICFGRRRDKNSERKLDSAGDNLVRVPSTPPMKNFIRILTFSIWVLVGIAFAGDFKSSIVTDGNPVSVHVANDQFLIIRNFTQDGPGTSRGFVTVIPNGQPSAKVLVAAILDTDNTTPLEVINNVVVAGPANVTATCETGGATCFITYRKGSN